MSLPMLHALLGPDSHGLDRFFGIGPGLSDDTRTPTSATPRIDPDDAFATHNGLPTETTQYTNLNQQSRQHRYQFTASNNDTYDQPQAQEHSYAAFLCEGPSTMFGNDPFDLFIGQENQPDPHQIFTSQSESMGDNTQEAGPVFTSPSGLPFPAAEDFHSSDHGDVSGTSWPPLDALASAEETGEGLQPWPSSSTTTNVPSATGLRSGLAVDTSSNTLSVEPSSSPLGSSASPAGLRPLGRANSSTSIGSAASSTGLSGVFDAGLDLDGTGGFRPSSSASASDSISELQSSPGSYTDEYPLPSTLGVDSAGASGQGASSPSSMSRASVSASSPSAGTSHRKVRYKCTAEQVEQLHAFFSANRNPTGKVRKELAARVGMPERSVQIWFQNRRAKIKHRGDSGSSVSRSSSLKRAGPAPKMSKSLSASGSAQGTDATASGLPAGSSTGPTRLPNARKSSKSKSTLSSFESVIQIPTFSICIGTWRRVRPLTCFFSRNHRFFGWTMRSDSVGFKMECPYSSVREVTFNGPIDPSMSELAEQICEPLGLLCIRLHRPPMFNMQTFKSASKPGEPEPVGTTWRQCEDFTEGRQGTTSLTHILSGPFTALRDVVLKLKESDADLSRRLYMNDEVTHHFSSQPSGSGSFSAASTIDGSMTGSASTGTTTTTSSLSDNWRHMQCAGTSSSEEENALQLRLDQSYFDPFHSQPELGGHHHPQSLRFRPGPSPAISVIPPPPMSSQQHQDAFQDTSSSELSHTGDHNVGMLQFPQRASMQTHHSAPSAYGLVSNAPVTSPGQQTSFGGVTGHNTGQGYETIGSLGLTGMDMPAGSNANTDLSRAVGIGGLLGTPSPWGGASHLSAPAAPQSSMMGPSWSPLEATGTPHDLRGTHPTQYHQETYLGTPSGQEEYPFFQ